MQGQNCRSFISNNLLCSKNFNMKEEVEKEEKAEAIRPIELQKERERNETVLSVKLQRERKKE